MAKSVTSKFKTNQKPQPPKNHKHIVIVGAGPGGLTAAMILAHRGFEVTVVEKEKQVGGRNAALRLKGYTFDVGPTFLMLKDVLDEVFEEAGQHSEAYMAFQKLEPMYRLQFDDRVMEPTTDHAAMRAQIAQQFPGEEAGLDKYMQTEKKRFDLMYPCLQKDYATFGQFFSREFRKALPHLSLGRTLMNVLGDYFKSEKLRLSFTFQAKYLGMSPWECPGAFGILSYIEHAFGVYHVQGGLSEISLGMAKVVKENGGKILLGSKVKQLILEGKTVKGVELENGKQILGDDVIINADFAHAMSHIVPKGVLRKYSPENLKKRDYSCSTFMLYLGLDKLYKMPHHTIAFAKDYHTNVDDIFQRKILSNDVSVYIRNASINDPTLAPKGHSAVYVLVPVANLSAQGIDWEKERPAFRNMVLKTIAARTLMKDIEKHIVVEKIISPDLWEKEYAVYNGATFNLAHQLTQMLYFRPRNRFEELNHCYLVGGGTHPGSGLPTIYESGRIAANLISRQHQVPFISKNLQT